MFGNPEPDFICGTIAGLMVLSGPPRGMSDELWEDREGASDEMFGGMAAVLREDVHC